jgi:hypothetical protein
MVPVIRISDENWARLKQWAVPLEDTTDTVLGRVLDAADAHKTGNSDKGQVPDKVVEQRRRLVEGRLSKGIKTPQTAYRRPILEALVELGGRSEVNKVLKLVESKMKGILNEVDYQPIRTGGIRWRNTAQWERHVMVKEGLLSSTSPDGIWEITDLGRRWLNEH